MDTILLQKQIRDNAEELRSYLQDLKSWESEMKRKEAEIHSTDSGGQPYPPVRTKKNKLSKGQKKCENQKEKSSKMSSFDYASWDKFDVDKACQDLDNEEEINKGHYEDFLSEIEEERKREEGVYEKERGNDFVKKQNWKEAIHCYNRAIKCYPHDAIFYANRALCYLKTQVYKSAEADCTTALQLDPNYVKAYQRRAMARAELGQLLEARADLLKVMEIEPKNMASKAELVKIEKKMNIKFDGKGIDKQSGSVSSKNTGLKSQQEVKNTKELHSKAEKLMEKQFKKSPVETSGKIQIEPHISNKEVTTERKLENEPTTPSTNSKVTEQKLDVSRLVDNKNQEILWPNDDAIKLVKPIQKAPHLRSKKPLKRIAIREVENSSLMEDKAISEPSVSSLLMKESKIEEDSNENQSLIVKDQDQGKNINHTDVDPICIEPSSTKQTLKLQNTTDRCTSTTSVIVSESSVEDKSTQLPPAPSSSVQFYVGWKKVKSNPQLSYLYLKQIPGLELARLFGDSLESNTFSDIISTLGTYFVQFKEQLLPYMIGLTKVRRFGALVLFLSEADKAGVKKILHYCKEQGECSHEEFTELMRKYELTQHF